MKEGASAYICICRLSSLVLAEGFVCRIEDKSIFECEICLLNI